MVCLHCKMLPVWSFVFLFCILGTITVTSQTGSWWVFFTFFMFLSLSVCPTVCVCEYVFPPPPNFHHHLVRKSQIFVVVSLVWHALSVSVDSAQELTASFHFRVVSMKGYRKSPLLVCFQCVCTTSCMNWNPSATACRRRLACEEHLRKSASDCSNR